MGERIRNHRRSHLIQISGQLFRPAFSALKVGGWQPAINAYRCETGFRVCVDLAGVENSSFELHVAPRRLLIRGRRMSPEPEGRGHRSIRVLALEIDHGPFEREIPLEADIEPHEATTEQRNGLLWISLPFRSHG